MKKTFVSLFIAAAALVACNKEQGPASSVVPSGEKVDLTVGVSGKGITKITGIKGDNTDEAKVNSLQVFVFNGETLDGYVSAANSLTATVECTAGTREVFAVVNADDLSSVVTSRTSLMSQVSSLGSTVSDFEMIGTKTDEITKGSDMTIEVDRFAARVVVKKVTNALSSGLASQTFTIKSIHINNVAADVDYGFSSGYTVDHWYHQTAFQASNTISGILADKPEATVAAGSSYSTAHYFYAYPNDEAMSIADAWSPRRTTVVLKVQIGDTLYDYPIILPELDSNHSYEIDEIKITRPGNKDDGEEGGEDEQKPVDGADCSFTIIVNPWTVVAVTEGTTI